VSDISNKFAVTPEILAKVEADRKERAAVVAEIWRAELTHKDWLFDGYPIRGRVMLARFNNLDWDSAWIDLGPSVAGNPGPYWHVPLKETIIDGKVYDLGDTVHRLYPKVLQSKWGILILHACYEAQKKAAAKS
jgi:hypothetical protein